MILLTPWTRLEELTWTLGVLRAGRLACSAAGEIPLGWLRVGRQSALASRILGKVGRWPELGSDVDCVRWSFEDPRMEVVAVALADLAKEAGVAVLDLALRLCDEALRGNEPTVETGVHAWVDDVVQCWKRAPAGAIVAAEVEDFWYQRLLMEALKAGVKRAGLYETMAESSADGCCDLARASGMFFHRHMGKLGQHVVHVSQNLEHVEALDQAYSEALRGDAPTSGPHLDARLEVGRLLGYPECCSKRYVDELTAYPGLSNAWLEMERRVEVAGSVSADMNPALDLWPLKAVPCGLHCPEARRVSSQLDLLAKATLPGEKWERLLDGARRPWLMSLEVDGAGVELLVDKAPEGRFKYRLGLVVSCLEEDADPVIRAMKIGDELEIEESILRVWRGGSVVADLSGRAYVWWHERSIQREFLAALLESRRQASARRTSLVASGRAGRQGWAGGSRYPMGNEAGQGGAVGVAECMADVAALVSVARSLPTLAGVTVEGPAIGLKAGVVELTIRSGSTLVVFRVTHAVSGRSFFEAGAWGFSYPKEAPLDTPPKQVLARRFADAMAEAVRRLAPT